MNLLNVKGMRRFLFVHPVYLGMISCKNCSSVLHGNYCSQCGQSAHAGKLDGHFLIHELQHGLLHADKGFLFTTKALFTQPGQMLRDYVAGKRVLQVSPLTFLLILAGLYALVAHYFESSILLPLKPSSHQAQLAVQQVNNWAAHHYAWLVLLQLPTAALFFYWLFKPLGTGYVEQVVIQAYLGGQRLLVRLLLLPLLHLLPMNTAGIGALIVDIVAPILLLLWAYRQYFDKQPGWAVVLRTLAAYALQLVAWIILMSAVLTAVAA